MKYYRIDTDCDENLKSPWDELSHDLAYDALDCLDGSLPLVAIWKSPLVRLEKRGKRPDIYSSFVLHYAVTKEVQHLLAPIVADDAEFLPLEIPELGSLYLIHPLWPIDLDENAIVTRNGYRGNISVVQKYSFTFDPDEYDGPRHVFRMRQAVGSIARDNGYTLCTLIVSEKFKQVCTESGVSGIVFHYVCSA